MNIKKSISARTKTFVEKTVFTNLARRNKLSYNQISDLPLELLETMETTANYNLNSNILLDIGAHKGLFSKAANLFFKFDKTICFEPNSHLNDTIRAQNNGIHLDIENIALSDMTGTSTFHLHEDSAMNSIVSSDKKILREEFPWDNPDLLKEIEVPVETLDNYIKDKKLQNNSFFIKIDTQGNELNVLKNSLETLKNTEIILIEFMFFSPYKTDFSFTDLINFLKEQSFVCEGAVTISKRPSKKISAVDFLFVKRE